MLHYISPDYDHQNDDFLQYSDYLREYCHTGKTPYFISDWNSDGYALSPTTLAQAAFNTSMKYVDHYYSSGENSCQDLIVDVLRKDFNQSYLRHQITIGNSATSLISFYIQIMISKGITNFLAIAPVYFSAIDAIHIGHGTITIVQPQLPNLLIDLVQLEDTIIKMNIQAVIITDPYFGFGKDVSQFEQIISLCKCYNCTIICDFARSGLSWVENNENIVFNEKIKLFESCERFALIYSPCKKIFANGIKSAVLITSKDFCQSAIDYSDSVLGSVSVAQLIFLRSLFDSSNEKEITSILQRNSAHVKSNYDKIQSCILGSGAVSYPPDTGNYMILGIPKISSDYATFKRILDTCNISTLPLSLYHFFDRTQYLFRINLSLEPVRLLSSILSLIEFIEYTQ